MDPKVLSIELDVAVPRACVSPILEQDVIEGVGGIDRVLDRREVPLTIRANHVLDAWGGRRPKGKSNTGEWKKKAQAATHAAILSQ
jgi:hypothetical protein